VRAPRSVAYARDLGTKKANIHSPFRTGGRMWHFNNTSTNPMSRAAPLPRASLKHRVSRRDGLMETQRLPRRGSGSEAAASAAAAAVATQHVILLAASSVRDEEMGIALLVHDPIQRWSPIGGRSERAAGVFTRGVALDCRRCALPRSDRQSVVLGGGLHYGWPCDGEASHRPTQRQCRRGRLTGAQADASQHVNRP
jgi:hypothetical protein